MHSVSKCIHPISQVKRKRSDSLGMKRAEMSGLFDGAMGTITKRLETCEYTSYMHSSLNYRNHSVTILSTLPLIHFLHLWNLKIEH